MIFSGWALPVEGQLFCIATDTIGAGDKVTSVPFPESAEAVNTYPIAVLEQSEHPELAQKFIDLVTGEAGQKVLNAAGFAAP